LRCYWHNFLLFFLIRFIFFPNGIIRDIRSTNINMVKTQNVTELYQQSKASLTQSLDDLQQREQQAQRDLKVITEDLNQQYKTARQAYQDQVTEIKSDRQQLETRKQRLDTLQHRWQQLCQDIAQQKSTFSILDHSPDPVNDRLNQVHQFRDQRQESIRQLKYEIEGAADEFSIKMNKDAEWRTLEEQLRHHFLQQWRPNLEREYRLHQLNKERSLYPSSSIEQFVRTRYDPLHVALFENIYTPGTLLERYSEIRSRMYLLVDRQRNNLSTRAMKKSEYYSILFSPPEELYSRFMKEAAKITLFEWTIEALQTTNKSVTKNQSRLQI